MKYRKQYAAIFKVYVQNHLQHRADLIISWILSTMTLVVQFTFWRSVYLGRTEMAGYELTDMITYTVLTTLLGKLLIYDGIHNQVAGDIREGKLAQFLWRPVDYRGYLFFSTIGKKVLDSVIMLLLSGILLIPLGSMGYFKIELTMERMVLFLISVCLAILLSFSLYYVLGLIAFWMLECSALYIMLGTLFYFLAGGMFPLDMFRQIKILSAILPFQYQLFFPIRICLGGLSRQEVIRGMGIQSVWCLILWFLSVILWKYGIRRYTSVGN